MTVQSIRIEFQIHFSIKRTCEIALDNHAAESLPASSFHPRAKRFPPIELDRLAVGAVAATPCDGHASVRHRKGAEFRGIDRKFMEREAQVLRRFGLERDRRPLDRDLIWLLRQNRPRAESGSARQGRPHTSFHAPEDRATQRVPVNVHQTGLGSFRLNRCAAPFAAPSTGLRRAGFSNGASVRAATTVNVLRPPCARSHRPTRRSARPPHQLRCAAAQYVDHASVSPARLRAALLPVWLRRSRVLRVSRRSWRNCYPISRISASVWPRKSSMERPNIGLLIEV